MALKTNVDVGAGQSEDHRAQRSEAASLLWSDSHLRADVNLKAPSLGSSREKHGRRSEKKGTHRLFQKHQYSCLLQQSHQVGAGKPQRGWWHIPSSLQACVVFPTLGLGTHSRETAETPPPRSTARNSGNLKITTLRAASSCAALPSNSHFVSMFLAFVCFFFSKSRRVRKKQNLYLCHLMT